MSTCIRLDLQTLVSTGYCAQKSLRSLVLTTLRFTLHPFPTIHLTYLRVDTILWCLVTTTLFVNGPN